MTDNHASVISSPPSISEGEFRRIRSESESEDIWKRGERERIESKVHRAPLLFGFFDSRLDDGGGEGIKVGREGGSIRPVFHRTRDEKTWVLHTSLFSVPSHLPLVLPVNLAAEGLGKKGREGDPGTRSSKALTGPSSR